MTLKTDIHVGDEGTILRAVITDLDVVVDISGATVKNIVLVKPDGEDFTVSGVFTTNGADGKIQYTTLATTLDVAGVWQIGAKIATSAGSWTATLVPFTVRETY